MTTSRRLVVAVITALLLTTALAEAAAPKDDTRATASATPTTPGAYDDIAFRFRARYSSSQATLVVQTTGPRKGCASVSKATRRHAGGVTQGDVIRFVVRAPKQGWCRGRHHVRLMAVADVDVATDDCDIVPEAGSSACPPEYERAYQVERRTNFTVSSH